MSRNPCEYYFRFLGIDDIKAFSSSRLFRVKVVDVRFNFVDQVLGRLRVVSFQGFYCCLVVDAEIDAGAIANDRSCKVES